MVTCGGQVSIPILYYMSKRMNVTYAEVVTQISASSAGMATREVNARWQADMAPFFESLTGNPDEAMLPLEEVFHLD